ncbi:hypothetical protein JOC95_000358 [Bacillus tianshenii]|uniref:Uncharacterized protein n=1 Tax=Sutcliffiella tianshenii TaxID=1463404 RepID=A0ABS2NV47_9BACI|nr:hypothetical protein [Bacillus tianshenii]MBM7618516.1 hypothetical protein [Bacillus tianshenii]
MSKQLVIGITGHRRIHTYFQQRIAQETDYFLKRIKGENQDCHLVLQSPLAEGADRIAAKAALLNGFELIVPLPFEIEEYRKDFDSEKSKMEFEELSSQATKVFVPELTDFKLKNRDDGYLRVGSYLAQSSHILLSLWDLRKDLELKGGTAHIIHYQLEGFPHDLYFKKALSDRKTFVIPTPRDGIRHTEELKGFYITNSIYKSLK